MELVLELVVELQLVLELAPEVLVVLAVKDSVS